MSKIILLGSPGENQVDLFAKIIFVNPLKGGIYITEFIRKRQNASSRPNWVDPPGEFRVFSAEERDICPSSY
jgi:hypothetical protein